MSKTKTVKCRYSHCKHESKDMPREEAVCDGRMYYHKDCYEEKETIKKCIDIYAKAFDADPIWNNLRIVINNIVYNKGNDAEYLLYALKYAARNKMTIRYPAGLYYLIKNKDIKESWEKEKKIADRGNVVVETTNTEFTYVPKKSKGFADIIGG